MKTNIPKVAILIDDMYQTLDVWYPYMRLRESGVQTILVGIEKRGYKSNENYPTSAEISIKEASAQNLAAVIIPGGYAPYILSKNREVKKFVKDMYNQDKVVAAICHGVWVPLSSGILKGKSAASLFTIRDDLMNAGAKFLDKDVVVDGKVITSPNTKNLPVFCQKLISMMNQPAFAY